MKTSHVLVVNPNTSPEVTESYLSVARSIAPSVTFTGVTGRFGARIVSTEAENIIAGHAALDLVAEHLPGPDAVILAISFDTGLSALRELLSIPVIGITEAALRAAESYDQRLGVVSFGEVSRPLYQALFKSYGTDPVGWHTIDIGSTADYLSVRAKENAVVAACERLEAAGAGAVVLCGAVVAGMAARLQEHVKCGIFDGAEAIPACLAALEDRQSPIRSMSPVSDSIGLSLALSALLRGDRR